MAAAFLHCGACPTHDRQVEGVGVEGPKCSKNDAGNATNRRTDSISPSRALITARTSCNLEPSTPTGKMMVVSAISWTKRNLKTSVNSREEATFHWVTGGWT
ncbi:hypothetical protein ZHAS_00005444 [Anopheles sinensis]|uniref:Uncharacterized protein n=1 Tax=Anopheles sinensis TaxID=74873 RepID=A0A084VJK6_ANOSI|nr:hypothetical protein ZHAS_00005444 [Anopheles sinensis]